MSIKSYKVILEESMKEYELLTGHKCDLTKDYCLPLVHQLCKKNLDKDRKNNELKFTSNELKYTSNKYSLYNIPIKFNSKPHTYSSYNNNNNWYNTNKYLNKYKVVTSGYTPSIAPKYTINCPICHKLNLVDLDKKLFGLSEKCKVCHDNPINVYLPDCGHACLCRECFDEIKH